MKLVHLLYASLCGTTLLMCWMMYSWKSTGHSGMPTLFGHLPTLGHHDSRAAQITGAKQDSKHTRGRKEPFVFSALKASEETHAALLSAFKTRNRALQLVRDFQKEPVVLIRNDDAVVDNCDIGCREMPGPVRLDGVLIMPGSNKEGMKVDKYSIAHTLESGVNYPQFQYEHLRNMSNVDIISTTSLRSDVPAGYNGWQISMWQKYNITEDLDLRTGVRENVAVAFISNCHSRLRTDAVEAMRAHGVLVHNYGNCQRTHTEEGNVKSPTAAYSDSEASKAFTLRKYKICLAFENSQEEDYVTEKFWQCLSHGGMTVVLGPPNALDFAPSGPDSISHVPSLDSIPQVSKRILSLMQNDAEYRQALEWKRNGLSKRFVALLDVQNVAHACRLCIHAADRLVREAHLKLLANGGSQGWGVCSLYDTAAGKLTHLVEVRERGTFYFRPVILTDAQLTVDALHEAIRLHFEEANYTPTFRQISTDFRKDWFGANGRLNVYLVYPYTANQREALFGEQGLTTDSKVRQAVVGRGTNEQCPKFEVIFI